MACLFCALSLLISIPTDYDCSYSYVYTYVCRGVHSIFKMECWIKDGPLGGGGEEGRELLYMIQNPNALGAVAVWET